MLVAKKLLWSFFGDMPAVNLISTFADGLATAKKKVVATPGPARDDGCLLWDGQLTIDRSENGTDVHPFALALIKPGLDAQRVMRGMGFDASACLRVVGAGSKHGRSDGLVRFFSGTSNEAHLRDFNRYPLEGFVRRVANQLLESFVIHEYLRVQRSDADQPRPWRRAKPRHYHFVDGIGVDRPSLESSG